MKYKVVEKFISINGEGLNSGMLTAFIRLQGCNLRCSYCDTMWANIETCEYNYESKEEILAFVKTEGVNRVTLTGGEPLIASNFNELIKYLLGNDLYVEIETNGSIDIKEYLSMRNDKISFTMDFKTLTSNESDKMLLSNLSVLNKKDCLKIVVGSIADLNQAKDLLDRYNLLDNTNVILSPVFGKIELPTIVDFMKENKLNDVKMQIQMHKIIWDETKRGV